MNGEIELHLIAQIQILFFFSGDQCLMVESNKVTIRGFEGFICLELPTAGTEGEVFLTDGAANDECTATVSLELFFCKI